MSRRRELAINKTIGLSPRQLVFVFGMEVAVVSLISFTLGTAAVWALSRRVAEAMGLTARIDPGVLIQTLATMGALVVMASAIPLAMAAAATVNQLLYGQKIYLFKRRTLLPLDGRGER
jgi:ABC-type antimicrobial peptide transport system permease subunit